MYDGVSISRIYGELGVWGPGCRCRDGEMESFGRDGRIWRTGAPLFEDPVDGESNQMQQVIRGTCSWSKSQPLYILGPTYQA